MIRKHLDYWYDKDGNKVYGDKKKYNKKLEYLLSYDPEEVISKKGLRNRKIINPIYRNLVSLTTKNKFKIDKESKLPKGRPIIFASTHGFRDDVALAIKTAGKYSYVLYGSLPDFYYSIDGIALWVNGVIMVDRKDKKSTKAALKKMEHAIDLGSNITIFPEGVWNKSKNKIILKLYPGIYKLAKSKNAIIVPIASIQSGNVCYSKRMKPIDIVKLDEEEALKELRDTLCRGKLELMLEHAKISREEIGNEKEYWDAFLEELIKTSNGLYDYEIEDSAEYVDKDIIDEKEVFDPIENIKVNYSNAFVYAKTSNNCRR